MEKTITLHFSHFVCKGTSQINFWGGGKGTITMDPFRISEGYTEENLKECINDGGFGCESIDGAVIDVYAVYVGDGCQTTRYHETHVVGQVSEELLEGA